MNAPKSHSQHNAMEIILRQMDFWYRSGLGAFLLEAEQAELDQCLPKYMGSYLLQIGGPSEVFLFEKSPIPYKARLTPEYHSVFLGPTIQSSFDNLPLLPESVDLLLMPHVLEFYADPQDLIHQIFNALRPDGTFIILGFNPYSPWGFKRTLNKQKTLPWRGHFHSATRVARWLGQAGFVIENQRNFFFRPPVNNEILHKKLLVLEGIGRLLWPNCGGVYLIVGKKVTPSLLPVSEELLRKSSVYTQPI